MQCEVAERVRSKHSLGIQRISLHDLGVASFNRAISPKYVHYLMKRILEQDGFSRFRYKNAIALQPNPDPEKRLGTYQRTMQEVERSNGLLARVEEKELYALATKNHLFLGLLALKSGAVKWDDNDKAVMAPPKQQGENHKELHETLQGGLFVEVLSADAWNETAEDLQALMEADNMDQATCMADHEVHLLDKTLTQMHKASQAMKKGERLWDAVWRFMGKGKDLGPFSKEDCVHSFNYTRALSEKHFFLLRMLHFHFINPCVLRVELESIGYLSHLSDECPFSRVAVLCRAYLGPKDAAFDSDSDERSTTVTTVLVLILVVQY